ncbi:terminase small subunit [Methylomagnum ishizawai]|uniref:terminase small subunit n=1 Tax=Methylomagnum ishizawai TaxID=1760988 RepID=UPI001C3281DD|nr:terminase small subunit [Methylomagnum ishizawai]BBL75599.1 hypothetical protein MishRS11D_26970 [Methylomagnum ishizawai]
MLIELEKPIKQRDFAALIDVSEARVSRLCKDGIIDPDASAGDMLRAYCAHMREMAAGRNASLAEERAGLAREQRLGQKIRNMQALGEWAPIDNLALALSRVTGQMATEFEAVPMLLKRAWPEISADQLNLVRDQLAKARNLLTSVGRDAIANEAARLVDYIDEFDDGKQTV